MSQIDNAAIKGYVTNFNTKGALADHARDAAFAQEQQDARKAVEQGKRTHEAANHLSLSILFMAPTSADIDNFFVILQNTPDDEIADTWKEIFQKLPKDPQDLAKNPDIAGKFRTDPQDPTSPLLPGLIDEVQVRTANQLQHDVTSARKNRDPEAVAEAFKRAFRTFVTEEITEPSFLRSEAYFWNDDNNKMVTRGLV